MPLVPGWLDLSTPDRPSYALACRQATGIDEEQLTLFDGTWMTKKHAKLAAFIKSKTFNIMGLPYDLRHRILEYVCDRKTMAVYLRGVNGHPPSAVPLPAITQAGDRKLRLESVLVSIKQTTLEIHSGPGNEKLQKRLTSLDLSISGETSLHSGYDAVHSLSFPYFSRFPHQSLPAGNPNNDIELMRKCANLREISLHFVSAELMYHGGEKSSTQLRGEYRLDRILHLQNLKRVDLIGPRPYSAGHEALQSIAAWLRGEYSIRLNLLDFKPNKAAKVFSVIVNGD